MPLIHHVGAFTTLLLSLLVLSSPAASSTTATYKVAGAWTSTAALPNGAQMTVLINLREDGTFDGQARVNESFVWDYAGKWKSDGKTIVYNYEKSSQPMPRDPYIDIDDIISVGPYNMLLRSRLSGKEHNFQRVN